MIQSINQSINHAISLTPPHEMPPKCSKLHAPFPIASANMFQALVDPPHDGNNLSFDGGDGRTAGSDDNTIVNACPRNSGSPASQEVPHIQHHHIVLDTIKDSILLLQQSATESFDGMTGYYKITQQLQTKVIAYMLCIDHTIGYTVDRMVAVLDAANNKDDHRFKALNRKMDSLLQKMDAGWTKNMA
jgi:hypothetical protein